MPADSLWTLDPETLPLRRNPASTPLPLSHGRRRLSRAHPPRAERYQTCGPAMNVELRPGTESDTGEASFLILLHSHEMRLSVPPHTEPKTLNCDNGD